MLSETVQIALITFASGAIGSALGFFGSLIVSKRQHRAEAQKHFFDVRRDSYSQVLRTYSECVKAENSKESLFAFSQAMCDAVLVSSDETCAVISEYINSGELFKPYSASIAANSVFDKLAERFRIDINDYLKLELSSTRKKKIKSKS